MGVWDDLLYEQQAAAMGIDTTRRYLPAHLRDVLPVQSPALVEVDDVPSRIEAEADERADA